MQRWDWYSTSLPVPDSGLDQLVSTFARELCATADFNARPRHGYQRAVSFRRAGFEVASANLGGRSCGGWQHVEASSDNAPAFADVARRLFPGHRVTRMDACEDFCFPGAWRTLFAVGLQFARDRGPEFKTRLIGDPRVEDDPAGRSLVLGSRSSDVSAQFYEKGKETGAALLSPEQADWVRAEVRVRPQGDARYAASRVQPEEAWGFSRWSRILLREINGLDVPRVNMHQHKLPDCDAAVFHMVRQYGSSVEDFCELHGFTREGFNRKFWELFDLYRRQRENREKSKTAA